METEYFTLEIVKLTDEAVLVNDGDQDAWLPKSQIEFDESAEEGDTTTFEIPEWLAIERGLV